MWTLCSIVSSILWSCDACEGEPVVNLDLCSVFVSSVIMYSTLVGVDVTHKLHWTPGEKVGVFQLCVCVCEDLEPHTHTDASFRATQLTSSARCLSGLWPSPSSASSSPTSGISRYSVSTGSTFEADDLMCLKINFCIFFISLFLIHEENQIAGRSGSAEPPLVRWATSSQPGGLRILPAAGGGQVGGLDGPAAQPSKGPQGGL